jgi:hypothetical protein
MIDPERPRKRPWVAIGVPRGWTPWKTARGSERDYSIDNRSRMRETLAVRGRRES